MRNRSLTTLIAGLFAALVLGLAACGDDEGTGGAVRADDFAPATEAPGDAAKGGTLEVIAEGDVDSIDPGIAYYQFSYMVTGATQRALFSWKPDDTAEPSLDLAASEPEISADGRTVTVKLRDGVRFSPPVDREVTSADVKYAIERGLLPGVANPYIGVYFSALKGYAAAEQAAADASSAPDISGIQTPDDGTIVFELTEPVAATLVQALSLPLGAPVPEEYARELDAETPSAYGENQVATGPYRIEADEDGALTGYSPGKEITLVRNPSWDAGTDFRPAYLDRVEIREGFTDIASAARRILEGEGQITGDIVPEGPSLELAATEHPEQLALTPSGGNRYIALNTKNPPLDDVNVRKAVLAATDREALRKARGGELVGPVANHFIPPDIPGFEEAGGEAGPGFDFLADPGGDPKLAAEYMRKAGYESGRYEGGEELLMVAEGTGADGRVAKVALDLFKKLGFEVELRQLSPDGVLSVCSRPAAEVAVCPTAAWAKDFNDPQTILDPTFNGDAIVSSGNSNWSQLDDPKINAAMNRARLITDPAERAEAWGRIDRQVTGQAAAVPVVWDYNGNLRSADVNGVVNLFNGVWDLSYTSLQR